MYNASLQALGVTKFLNLERIIAWQVSQNFLLLCCLVEQRSSVVQQEHLTGTSLVTDGSVSSVGTIKYYPYGSTRSGSVPTDKKFTG